MSKRRVAHSDYEQGRLDELAFWGAFFGWQVKIGLIVLLVVLLVAAARMQP